MTSKKEYSDAALKACQNQLGLIEESIEGITKSIQPLEDKRGKLRIDAENLRGAIKIMEGIKKPDESAPTYQPPARPKCKKCNAENTQKQGTRKIKGTIMQVWKCMGCGHKFTLPLETFEISSPMSHRPRVGKPRGPLKKLRGNSGELKRVVNEIQKRIDSGESLLYQDIAEQHNTGESIAWQAGRVLIDESPRKYEQYKDIMKKYHIKGIRLIDPEKRKNSKATGVFCPKCKSLLIPGQTCKKCNS